MMRVGNSLQENSFIRSLPQIWRRHDLPKQLNQNLLHDLPFIVTVHRLQSRDSSAKATVGCRPSLADLTFGQFLSLGSLSCHGGPKFSA
ncbi:hypothetical protein NL676_037229 [Syzygium grande]|nr:hypothetical protein NL676_037229 [Syzygium grande]